MVLCKTFKKIRLKTNNYTELDKLFIENDDDVYQEEDDVNEFTNIHDYLNKNLFEPFKSICMKKY
jgi:hypothetical protein